ncbi:MAG TPA: hypothetical protein VHZ24_08185 [Pirellulales bacterium]|nr:hypothetical protein [Pirellulales bacterium]
MILHEQPLELVQFRSVEAAAAFQANRLKPELGLARVALDVRVWWFRAVAGIEKRNDMGRTA